MTDTNTTAATEPTEGAAPAPTTMTLDQAIALIDFAPVREMVAEKLGAAVKLIQENNSRVLAIREAKDTDPNNTEYLDIVWHRVIADGTEDKEMIAAERKYQAAQAESEKQLKILRDAAKARHIKPPMSEEDKQKTKKLINDGKPVITAARAAAEQFAEMADKLLIAAGKPVPEGGVITLLPETESLIQARGRKAASGGGTKPYSTRLVEAFIDGKSTNRLKKNKQGEMALAGHFNYVAEDLSKEFGAATFPQNEVTSEEVETAYYASKDVAFREAGDMPEDHTFTFTKNVTVQAPNDDSTKTEPHTKQIRVIRWTAETAGIAKPDEAKADDAKPEDNAGEDKAPAPANAQFTPAGPAKPVDKKK